MWTHAGNNFIVYISLILIKKEVRIRLATASSGTAATLLKGGRTAHSQFGIQIPILPISTCTIEPNSVALILRTNLAPTDTN